MTRKKYERVKVGDTVVWNMTGADQVTQHEVTDLYKDHKGEEWVALDGNGRADSCTIWYGAVRPVPKMPNRGVPMTSLQGRHQVIDERLADNDLAPLAYFIASRCNDPRTEPVTAEQVLGWLDEHATFTKKKHYRELTYAFALGSLNLPSILEAV